MEAIVLAGGLGTRLASRLDGIPKPMAPIAGRPFLEILLHQLVLAECDRVVLSVGHRYHAIQIHFGSSFENMPIQYAVEEAPLGTGGAIRMALDRSLEESVLVLNGDTFLNVDYRAMLKLHERERAAITLAVTPQSDTARYGGVVVKGDRITAFEEKGRSGAGLINGGVYAMRTEFPWPLHLPPSFSFERDVLVPEVHRLGPLAFHVDGYFLDIGIPEDLDRAQIELARMKLQHR
jgi:D-glycero-alpha-D-manno-heptose 1-phosphate guanylyltransferase